MIDWSEKMAKNSREVNKGFIRCSLTMIEETLSFPYKSALEKSQNTPNIEFFRKFSNYIHLQNTGKMRKELDEAHYHIERNANAKILFLAVSLRLAYLLKVEKNNEYTILLTE